MLTIPNIESSPTFDGQSVPDLTDWTAMSALGNNNGVLTGCGVSAASGMNVAVAAGTVIIGGVTINVAAVASLAIGAASASDRRDIVVVNNAGTVSVVAGTACGTAGWIRTSVGLPPVKASIPANSVLLGEVYVGSATASIASGNIVDKTCIAFDPAVVAVNSQSGTTYTLALSDKGEVVECNNASAITVTIPTNASVAFPVGTLIEIFQLGAGQVTVAVAGGVTLRAPNGAKTAVQYSTVALRKRGTDEWVISGDTAP